MLDLDRRRLLLIAALAVVVAVLGVRLLRERASAAGQGATVVAVGAGRGSAAGAGAGGASRRGGSADGVRISRTSGGATVHVAGAVRRPGVYRLRDGARVDDAVRRAGGPARQADLTAINLAATVEDGRQVVVPVRGPTAAGAAAGATAGGGAAGGVAASGGPAAAAGGQPPKVNLNTATPEQLDALDGVGPATARKILAYRAEQGGFGRVEELGDVPGIGEKRLAALRLAVTL